MFSHGRSPRQSCDVILEPAYPNPHADQVIVMVHDWFYQVAISSDRTMISPATLEARLLGIMSDVNKRLSMGEKAHPIGVLSADQRDTWAQVRLVRVANLFVQELRRICNAYSAFHLRIAKLMTRSCIQ